MPSAAVLPPVAPPEARQVLLRASTELVLQPAEGGMPAEGGKAMVHPPAFLALLQNL